MAIDLFLAMTAAELERNNPQEKCAWMACHFSSYGTGLTNLPSHLPPGSLLILNDRTPVRGHDPKTVSDALLKTVKKLQCSGILLDFQGENSAEIWHIMEALALLPYPVCVSDVYADKGNGPVFVRPVPVNTPVEDWLQKWQGREIWLDVSREQIHYTVTEEGCRETPAPLQSASALPSQDEQLHCHYRIELHDDRAEFTLQRTRQDIADLLCAAEGLGVTKAVGLWQELK